MTRILFTGGGGSASQSLQEQWGDRYDLWFADASPDGFPPNLPRQRCLNVPFANDSAFVPAMRELCDRHSIDVLVPGVDEELLPLAALKGAEGWPHILIPPASFVTTMLDKFHCIQALAKVGLEVPTTVMLDDHDGLKKMSFPLIVKPRSGRGSRGVMKLDRIEQVSAYVTLQDGKASDYIAQELGEGDEYTVLIAGDKDGALRAIVPVCAFEKRGITVRAETATPGPIINYAKRLQAALGPSGVYNLQCMLTSEGRIVPFEVNPRISTTFVLCIATGYDPISMILGDDSSEKSSDVFLPQHTFTLSRSWLTSISRKE